jgi:hypothetical protein
MNIKNNTRLAATLLFLTITCASNANAGTKQKPPVADSQIEVVWYQPIIDLFNF